MTGKPTVPAILLLPQPQVQPVVGLGWLATVYAMDPALAAADGADDQTAAMTVELAEPEELNEIDRMADAVRVVSADELNEIDMAADSTSATTGHASSEPIPPTAMGAAPGPTPTSWIVGLVIAFGGVVAAASTMVFRRIRA